jgi:hypothetical protein
VRSAWTTPRAIRLHLTLIVLVPTFLLLARWQIRRALGGNGLSWAYAFEWPLFAVYAVVVWWRILHDDAPPRPKRRATDALQTTETPPTPRTMNAKEARAEAERVEYNAYLAALREEDDARERRNA